MAVSLVICDYEYSMLTENDRPILTPKSVLPLFFIVGVIFAPIGGLLLWASSQVGAGISIFDLATSCSDARLTSGQKVQEIVLDYSECATDAPLEPSPAVSIADRVSTSFKSANMDYTPTWQRLDDNGSTVCRLMFKIPEDMGPPVFMYYRLTNFYQNHRRYVKSLDMEQLKGKALDNKTISGGSCDPLKLDPSGKAYYPCGLIANSMFNDTINSPQLLTVADDAEPYVMSNKNIAWDSDKELFKKTSYTSDQVVPPPNWRERYPNGYADGIPDLNQDEDFMVWMRTAALPTFSKLSRRNDTAKMPAGIYRLDIVDRKSILPNGLSNTADLLSLRLPSDGIWRYEINSYIYAYSRRWPKPLHGDCICCCWWHLRPPRGPFHPCTFSQTSVSVSLSSTWHCSQQRRMLTQLVVNSGTILI